MLLVNLCPSLVPTVQVKMELPGEQMKQETMIWTRPSVTEQPKDTEDRECPHLWGIRAFCDPRHLKHTATLGLTTECFIYLLVCFAFQC